jgi:hypothetical protein
MNRITKIIVVADADSNVRDSMESGDYGHWGSNSTSAFANWTSYRGLINDPVDESMFEIDCMVDDTLFLRLKDEVEIEEMDIDFITSARAWKPSKVS